MCKVFGVAGINDKNRGDIIRIIKEVSKEMVKFEKDGFGYSAIDKNGKVYGEKWLKPEHVFSKRLKRKHKPAREVIPKADRKVLTEFDGLLEDYAPLIQKSAPPVYDNFGDGNLGDATAIIMHSRLSTGASKSIENVHPFVNFETALVHNGIVYNEEEEIFYKQVSDCDSEILLNQYNSELVQMDSRRIAAAMAPVEAYFACLVLTQAMNKDENMYPVLDIFKADANLEVVYIHDLDVFAFCTLGSIIVDVCKSIGYSTSVPIKIKDNYLIRIDAVTGKIVEKEYFEYEGGHSWAGSTSYNGWSSPNNEKYYKSRYGQEWESEMERDMLDDIPDHKEYKDDKDMDEPLYRSAEESAKVFTESSNNKLIEMTKDPLNNGSEFTNEDINTVLLTEEEITVQSILNKHRDKGTRHA